MKLRWLAVSSLVILMALITLFGGFAFYWKFDQLLQHNLEQQIAEISVNKQQQLSQLTHLAVDQLKSIPQVDIEDQTALVVLKDALSRSLFREIVFLDPNGIIVVSTNPNHLGKDLSHNATFSQGKNDTYISSLIQNFSNLSPTILIGTPIKDADNNLVAVLVGAIDDNYIANILNQKMGAPIIQTSLANSVSVLGSADKSLFSTCLDQHPQSLISDHQQNIYLIWDELTHTCLLHQVDPAAVHFFINPINHLLGFVLLTITITFMITWALSGNFTREITKITQGINQLVNHDYTHPIIASSNHEINQSLAGLEKLRGRFQYAHEDLETKIISRTQELNQKVIALEKFRDITTDMIIKSDPKSKHDH